MKFDPRGGGLTFKVSMNPQTEIFPTPTSKPVPGYPGYFADLAGNVWSHRSGAPKLLKPYVSRHKKGYPQVYIRQPSGKWRHLKQHTLVALAFHGPRPSQLPVTRHLNGIKTDNRPENLRYGTYEENGDDKVRLMEGCRGSSHRMAVLTEAKVAQIKSALAAGGTAKEIAKTFGISPSKVSSLWTGRSWRHVPDPPSIRGSPS